MKELKEIIEKLYHYIPPKIAQDFFKDNPDLYYRVVEAFMGVKFKNQSQKWKSKAFPTYEDFIQAVIVGFNPYRRSRGRKDKGIIQSVQEYNPYKKVKDVILQTIDGVEQAICPHCLLRKETISLWPHISGNPLPEEQAPKSRHNMHNKYCGKVVRELTNRQVKKFRSEISEVIHKNGKHYEVCNFINRLSSVKKHISRLTQYFVQDIRKEEYGRKRSIVQHPFYECTKCHNLTPDLSIGHRKKKIKCDTCGSMIKISPASTNMNKPLWKSRAGAYVSLNDTREGDEARPPLSEIISGYDPSAIFNLDQTVFISNLTEKGELLQQKLVDRIRYLCASTLPKKRHESMLKDESVKKVKGIPETLNFKIFHKYFYMRSAAETNGEGKSMTYRVLAKEFLQKEQHYSECLDCSRRMNEPTESAKLKKIGLRKTCEKCNVTNLKYHGPRCGREDSKDPTCKKHGDLVVAMYIFQTIEPKIRRVEKLIQNDKACYEIYLQIIETKKAQDELESYEELAKNLNF